VVRSDNARFTKRERLSKREFKEVFSKGKRFSDRILTVYVLEGEERKAGFVVRRTLRSAVKRNRLKRFLREIFRQNKHRLSEKALIIVLVGKESAGLCFSELESSLLKVLKKAGILSE